MASAGALSITGARLVAGFDLVAEEIGLAGDSLR